MGWETLVLSFGSGFRYEMTPDDPYIQTLKTNVAKASAMGIECGGYDLTVLDRGHNGYGGDVGAQWDRVDPKTGALSPDACYASGWRDKLEVTATISLPSGLHSSQDGSDISLSTGHALPCH